MESRPGVFPRSLEGRALGRSEIANEDIPVASIAYPLTAVALSPKSSPPFDLFYDFYVSILLAVPLALICHCDSPTP